MGSTNGLIHFTLIPRGEITSFLNGLQQQIKFVTKSGKNIENLHFLLIVNRCSHYGIHLMMKFVHVHKALQYNDCFRLYTNYDIKERKRIYPCCSVLAQWCWQERNIGEGAKSSFFPTNINLLYSRRNTLTYPSLSLYITLCLKSETIVFKRALCTRTNISL